MDGRSHFEWGTQDWVQIAPRVPVGQRFSPTSGEVLLCGKLRKDSGPVPTTSSAPLPASSPTLPTTLLLPSSAQLPPSSPTTLLPTSSAPLPPSSPTTLLPTSSAPLPPSSPTTLLPTSSAPLPPSSPTTLLPTSSAQLPPSSPTTLLPTSSAPLPPSSPTTLLPTSSAPPPVPSSTLSSALLPASSPSTSPSASSTFTNGDFLALMWSARKLECLGGVDFGDGNVCEKFYEIMSKWLLHVATVGRRTSHAVLAKCQRLEKKFKQLEKAYNRRSTDKKHNELYTFLDDSLDWQLSDLRAKLLDEDYSHAQSHPCIPSPALANVQTETLIRTDGEEIILRKGKALLSQDTVNLQKEKEKLIREVNKQTKKANSFEKQASELSTAISKGMQAVVQEAADLKLKNTELFEKKAAVTTKYRDLKRKTVLRSVHENTIGRVVEENKELKRDNIRLNLELEATEVENVKLDKKIEGLHKKSNRLRMSSTRKGITLEQTKAKELATIGDFKLDKEASEKYQKQIFKLLEAEVANGKKTREELQREIDAMHQIDTKNGGVYTAKIRLMYCDLLAKGVSANIIQSVVQSVLGHTTSVDMASLQLPSRSSAQRMVLEAGELAKVRTAFELLQTKGDIGHHSDGTTKSLIHWGMHVLKLNCEGETKAFTLTASPVPSGKASDTVDQLKASMAELEVLARDMGMEPGNAFSLNRIVARMSDRANNERAVTKLLQLEKGKTQEETPEWQQMTDEEKDARNKIYDFTCAAHKINNVANAMTEASASHLYPHAETANARGLVGAKKQIYEVNKLICEQSRKEYSRGKDFKMFCLDQSEETYKGTAAQLLLPVVGNRYIVFLLNSIPTLMSKEIILVFLESLKDSKQGAATLNRLEASVWNGYMSADIEAELCAWSLMYYFVCQPLLSRAKAAKSPLDMNFFYLTAVRRLAHLETDSSQLLDEDPEMFAGAVSETEPYRPYIPDVQIQAKIEPQFKDKVCEILCVMATAGKEKLIAHSHEHLPNGVYHEPGEGAIAAGQLLGSATNDTVESGFGLLDRLQTTSSTRNPIHTSALVTAKRDKPVDFVKQQDVETQELMMSTARKSAHRMRKQAGTTNQQLLKLWQSGSEEREARIKQRRHLREKKKARDESLGKQIEAGDLATKTTLLNRMNGKELLSQLHMWTHIKNLGIHFEQQDLLKGSTTTKVAEKRDILKTLIDKNAQLPGVLKARYQCQTTAARVTVECPAVEDVDNVTDSEEDNEDMQTYQSGEHPFSFSKTMVGTVVVVAFAGGVWYPGVVDVLLTPALATINYLHAKTMTVPLPEKTEFHFPLGKPDKMDTDATSVFEWSLDIEPVSASCRTYRLSKSILHINNKYKQFATLHNLPQ